MPNFPPARLPNRRDFCSRLAAGLLSAAMLDTAASSLPARPKSAPISLTLGIGNYGMQSLPVDRAVALIAGTGFDSLELTMMPDWPSAPPRMDRACRADLRRQIADTGLRFVSLMEDIHPADDDNRHQQGLVRLKQAIELGHSLAPDRPPLIQTVLGGGAWSGKKDLFVDRLGSWRDLAKSSETVIAVKPHRSGAMSQPAEGAWLLDQLGNPSSLGLVYDYSHYAFRDLSIDRTITAARGRIVHVAVKDAVRQGEQVEFDLPGSAGTIDYPAILRGLVEAGYRGDICCEVSSQIFRRDGYDAVEATRACYRQMSPILRQAQLRR